MITLSSNDSFSTIGMKLFAHCIFVSCIGLGIYVPWGAPQNKVVPITFSGTTVQQHQINGKVVDERTGEAIAYCNISLSNTSVGTSSNELGEFVINADLLPVKLVFSHINYGQHVFEVTKTSDVVVSLVPKTNSLEEVVVLASKKDRFAVDLAKKAFEKAQKTSTQNRYGKALYRQKSKNGDRYSEFSEIIYDIRYTTRGIEDWDILEGRYALKKGGVHNKNFTLLSRLLKPLQPETDELIFPLHPSFEVFYDVRVLEYIESGDDKIAVLGFSPKEKITTPTFEGEVYINVKNFDILKVIGNLAQDNLKLVKLVDKKSFWKNYKISFEIAYRQDSVLKSVIDFVKVDQGFDYYKNDSLKFRATAASNLTFLEHYVPTSRKKLGSQFRKNRSDWQKLDKIGYNEKFWAENPFVKRTPLEEEVIAAFEGERAFGSIFLNSRDQVALMQSDISADPLVRELGIHVNRYNNYNPVEKTYLHTDKDLFAAGETVWYGGYTVLGSYHHFSMGSKVLHVDLIGPKNKIVVSQTHELVDGKATGSLELPEDLSAGNYRIRAYTNWMRNFDPDFFFTKTIQVLNAKSAVPAASDADGKIDLQFFPEGGHAVVGLTGKVAFKALGSDGLGRKIQGRLLDSQGEFVATLGTIARGAGFFSFTPQSQEQYTAVLKDGTKYPFPQIMGEGYGMTVNNINPKSIQVKIQATSALKGKPFYILGHINNKKYYQGKFEFGDRPTVDFEIPKNKMPSGVMTITLLDRNKKPWCERAVFVNNQEELVISAAIRPKKFGPRDKVAMDIRVTDTDGRPVSTELSIAVTDMGQTVKDPRSGNVLTHLLLQSDLKGHIKEPALLFADQKRATLHGLDLVMLTHGWRKFPWLEMDQVPNAPKEFSFSKGLPISGTARDLKGRPLANTSLNMVAKAGENIGMLTARTLQDGTFSFPDFNFSGPTEIAFNAYDLSDRPVDVRVILKSPKTTLPSPQFNGTVYALTGETESYESITPVRKRMELLFDLSNTTELDEVVVTEKRIERSRNESPSMYGLTPDATLYTSDHGSAQTVLDLVTRFAGVQVNGRTVSIRNGGTPLWVLNGIPVANDNPSAHEQALQAAAAARRAGEPGEISLSISQSVAAGPAPTFVANMDTYSVERIELLKGPSAAIYGSRGANGVILIYTKKGGGTIAKPVVSPDFTVLGHTATRKFYSPKYNAKPDAHQTPDYRATLYWNPSFTTDKYGNATLSFYNSDNADQIQVDIQGLSVYGTPGAYLEVFGKDN